MKNYEITFKLDDVTVVKTVSAKSVDAAVDSVFSKAKGLLNNGRSIVAFHVLLDDGRHTTVFRERKK